MIVGMGANKVAVCIALAAVALIVVPGGSASQPMLLLSPPTLRPGFRKSSDQNTRVHLVGRLWLVARDWGPPSVGNSGRRGGDAKVIY